MAPAILEHDEFHSRFPSNPISVESSTLLVYLFIINVVAIIFYLFICSWIYLLISFDYFYIYLFDCLNFLFDFF
jgi:hypothetical protein